MEQKVEKVDSKKDGTTFTRTKMLLEFGPIMLWKDMVFGSQVKET